MSTKISGGIVLKLLEFLYRLAVGILEPKLKPTTTSNLSGSSGLEYSNAARVSNSA